MADVRPWLNHNGLAVYRIAVGEPIVFMPGPHRFERVGLAGADALIAGLVKLGRQVLTFDPPGSGLSTRVARPGLTEMHTCVDEVLACAGLSEPVDFIGHSMGGLVTLAYALERPARARRIVLVGTGSGRPAYTKAPGALWNAGHPGFRRMAMLGILQQAWPARGPERVLNNLIQEESFVDRGLADHRQVGWRDWFRAREGWAGWHWQARKLDYSHRLTEITAPCLILCGRHDPQFPLACSEQLAQGIPDAHLVVFEHSGHSPFIEEPAAFWAAVDRFVG